MGSNPIAGSIMQDDAMEWIAVSNSPTLQLLVQVGFIAGLALFYTAIVGGMSGLMLGTMIGGPLSSLFGGNLNLGLTVFFVAFVLYLLNERRNERSDPGDSTD